MTKHHTPVLSCRLFRRRTSTQRPRPTCAASSDSTTITPSFPFHPCIFYTECRDTIRLGYVKGAIDALTYHIQTLAAEQQPFLIQDTDSFWFFGHIQSNKCQEMQPWVWAYCFATYFGFLLSGLISPTDYPVVLMAGSGSVKLPNKEPDCSVNVLLPVGVTAPEWSRVASAGRNPHIRAITDWPGFHLASQLARQSASQLPRPYGFH